VHLDASSGFFFDKVTSEKTADWSILLT